MKHFVLGLLLGVFVSALVVATALAILANRPVSVPQPVPTPATTGDITVSIQESYLGSLATELAHEQEPMIQTVTVDVQPNSRVSMILGVQVTILGQALDLKVQLSNTVRVADGHLQFDLQDIQVAGLDIPLDLLPQSLRTTLQTAVSDINDRADRMLEQNGLVPLGVTTDDSGITVSLRVR